MTGSIFVSMASYRDTEAPATLTDMYAKAERPERIFTGVFWQVVPGEDDDCVGIPAGIDSGQVRQLRVHAAESRGVCWARHCIQVQLFGDEDYYLQIDSHMRFVPGWDTRLERMLARCPASRAIVATYPVGYTPPDRLGPEAICVLRPKEFDADGVLSLIARSFEPREAPAVPQPNPFIAAGFLFGPGSLVREVPYDPHLYFRGEEITLAARLWTAGFDLFSPDEHLIYHDYTRDRGRRLHWSDNTDWSGRNKASIARVRHLLGIEPATDAAALVEIRRYGLGEARTLEQYQEFADIDFARQQIGARAKEGRYSIAALPGAAAREFERIHRNNLWKCPETRSGTGSTWRSTADLRPALAALLEQFDIRTLVDAGCGDFHWIEQLCGGLDLYLGYDLVPDVVTGNLRRTAGRPGLLFGLADITRSQLPRADAILCRHCLTHLPNTEVCRALELFRASGARYLLTTSYASGENRDVNAGGWRPLDITGAPFSLGPPVRRIVDIQGTSGCFLGLWSLNSRESDTGNG